MPDTSLEDYLAAVRPEAQETVRALASAIDAAGIAFDRRFTYQMLVYTFESRWHDWVVGISVSTKVVSLRFLYGRGLEDPAGLLRPGSTTAAAIDYASAVEVDADIVSGYVREAAAKHPRREPRP